jgi:hypothetical protein
MNRKPILLVAVFAAALLWPSLADAQIAEREYGPAVEGSGRYTLDSGLQLAAGVTYSSMSVDAVPDNRTALTSLASLAPAISRPTASRSTGR